MYLKCIVFIFIMCLGVRVCVCVVYVGVYMYVCALVWVPMRGINSWIWSYMLLWVTEFGYWEQNSNPLKVQEVLLTTEPAPQPQTYPF